MPSLLDDLRKKREAAGVGAVPDIMRSDGLASSLSIGLSSDPDKEIEVREDAKALGVAPDAVRDQPEARTRASLSRIQSHVEGRRPITEDFLTDPDNAAIAHDDVETLTEIEEEAGFFGRLHDFLHENVTEPLIEFGDDFEGALFSDTSVGEVVDLAGPAYTQGWIINRLGHAGHDLRNASDPVERERIHGKIADMQSEIENLGVSYEGWRGYITSAAEIVGQQAASLAQADAAKRVLTGATGGTIAGAAIGFAAGPAAPIVAPITAAGGAVAGGISGLVSHLATDAFIVESGHSYIDLIEQGVPEPEAEILSVGVGVINASLEMLGMGMIAKPFTKAIKPVLNKALGEAVKRPSVRRAAARAVGTWSTAVGGETGTEIIQESVNIAAEEAGKIFQDGLTDDFSLEEATDRLEEIAVKTFKGMAVLGLPGAGVSYQTDRSKAKRAKQAETSFRRLHSLVGESKLARRSPEAAVNHLEKSLGVSSVQMPVEQFNNLVADLDGVPTDLLPDERLMQIYNEAAAINGDVTLPVGNFMRALLMQDDKLLFERYQPHVRWGPGEMTATEAAEFQTSGVVDALAGNVQALAEDQAQVEDLLIQDRVSSLSDDVLAAIKGSTGIPEGIPYSVVQVVEEQAASFIEEIKNATGKDINENRALAEAVAEATGQDINEARGFAQDVASLTGRDIDKSRALAQSIAKATGGDINQARALAQSFAEATGVEITQDRAIAEGVSGTGGPDARPVVVGPSGKPETSGPDARPIVIGPDGKVGVAGPETRPEVVGPKGKRDDAGPETRPPVIGPSGRLETGGPETRPIVIGPDGKAEALGPDTRPVVIGPGGRPETSGPNSRPLVVGPDGKVGITGPETRPEVVGPKGKRDDAGPETRPIVVGPGGRLETSGPDSRPIVIGPDGRVELGGPETRPSVVGPSGKPDSAGPETRPIVVGPSGWLETGGPDARPIVIGPDGRVEAMGPETRPIVVGPDGKLTTSGPDTRPVVVGPDGRLGTSGPETRPNNQPSEGLRNTPEEVGKEFGDKLIAALEAAMPAEATAPIMAPVRERAVTFAEDIVANLETATPAQPGTPILLGVADQDIALAMDSLGLQALFKTAREAGMTEKQYGNYLDAIQRAANRSKNRKGVAQAKREKRQVGKEIKEATKEIANEVTESLGNEPVYSALRGLGPDKLDRASIIRDFGDNDGAQAIRELRAAGASITNLKEPGGIDINTWADLYDFDAGDIMVNTMRDATPEKQEIQKRAKEQVEQRRPDLFSRQADLQETIVALLHDDTGAVIAAEVAALSTDKKAGRIKPTQVRELARRTMDQHQIKDVTVNKYLNNARRHGQEAGRSLRRGDREGARAKKVDQLLSVEFAREAEVRRARIDSGRKYMSQFMQSKRKWPTLGPGYIEAIRDTVDQFSMSPRLSPNKREQLEKFVTKAQADGAHFEFPARLLDGDKRNYQDMTLHEFELVVQKVRELQHSGIQASRSLKQDRENTIGIRVDSLVDTLQSKEQPEQTLETRGRRKGISKAYTEAKLLLLNTDSVLRDLDNFTELGPAYQAIKAPIDKATVDGYKVKTNVGLINRQSDIAEKMLELYKVYTPRELNTLSKRNVKVQGFTKPLSRNAFLSILLNAGNEQNRQALMDSGQLTSDQLEAVIEHADKRDMDFVQSVWDYLDSFWGEIEGATQRRRGFKPDKVETTPLETEHGIYKGGYYPLRYDSDKGVSDTSSDSVEEQIAQVRYGRAIASHTRRDHTEQRVGSGGRPVLLDLFTTHSHLDQVAYDLELGDAVNEVYSVLYDDRTKKAFRDAGRNETWRALDLWLGDVVTGEMHSGGVVERGLRWLRAGFTVSKLGWNVGVAGIQVVGILQTSVLIGKGNTLAGLKDMLSMPLVGKNSVFKFTIEQSQVMAQREETFHKDIADASQLVSDSYLKRFAPAGSVEFINNSLFYGIKKMQRFVDTWTWMAAKRAGLKKFDNDEAKSTEFADRMVIRAQASGNFQERTAFERGSINPKIRQSELVRSFTALISYFMAKNNVAYERTKKTNFRNPGQVIGWATDMALLYVVEAALVSILRGQWPDDDNDEDVMLHLASEGASSLFAGIPMIREFASEAAGFRGGGVFSSVIADTAKVIEQVGQGEIDEALLTSANNLGGTLFKYPSSQINKTGRAIVQYSEGEEVDWLEYFMGPKFDKHR